MSSLFSPILCCAGHDFVITDRIGGLDKGDDDVDLEQQKPSYPYGKAWTCFIKVERLS